jgi:phage FluMu protein Com
MPIEFRCSHCGKLLRTGDGTAGRQAQCPECATICTVPSASAPTGPIPASPSGGNPFGAIPRPSETGGAENPYQSPYVTGSASDGSSSASDGGSKATVALVLSIIGLVMWCCPLFGFLITILGLVFGILALRDRTNSIPIIAIILSSIGLFLCLINSLTGVWMMVHRQNAPFP